MLEVLYKNPFMIKGYFTFYIETLNLVYDNLTWARVRGGEACSLEENISYVFSINIFIPVSVYQKLQNLKLKDYIEYQLSSVLSFHFLKCPKLHKSSG